MIYFVFRQADYSPRIAIVLGPGLNSLRERRHHETLRNESGQAHVAVAVSGDYPVSTYARRGWTMTCDENKQELDPQTIIMGLGYATTLLVAIGWAATLAL